MERVIAGETSANECKHEQRELLGFLACRAGSLKAYFDRKSADFLIYSSSAPFQPWEAANETGTAGASRPGFCVQIFESILFCQDSAFLSWHFSISIVIQGARVAANAWWSFAAPFLFLGENYLFEFKRWVSRKSASFWCANTIFSLKGYLICGPWYGGSIRLINITSARLS